jgi:hypothetical protein
MFNENPKAIFPSIESGNHQVKITYSLYGDPILKSLIAGCEPTLT